MLRYAFYLGSTTAFLVGLYLSVIDQHQKSQPALVLAGFIFGATGGCIIHHLRQKRKSTAATLKPPTPQL
jgi:ABC-type uncharacterized transport system permease subunit